MNKICSAGLAAVIGLVMAGGVSARSEMDPMGGMNEHAMKPEGTGAEHGIGHIAGAGYQVQNTKDGVVLTITSKDPATVKKIQEAAQTLAAPNAAAAHPDEMVVCPVYGTKMKKSQAFDSVVYQGKTYYFCCAACKPLFLKNPQKYAGR